MSGWQPIETAPKTGQKILLADYSGYATRGDDGMWIVSAHWTLYGDLKNGYWTDGVDKLYSPSHWMPLPEPPSSSPAAVLDTIPTAGPSCEGGA